MSASQPEVRVQWAQNTVSSVTPRELPSGLICSPKVCIDGKVYGHRYLEHRESRTRAGPGRRAGKAGEGDDEPERRERTEAATHD